MSERSRWIDKLTSRMESRASYIRGKINVLVPAQLHALRLRNGKKQRELAHMAGMKQSRISAMECPGAVNFNLETLIRMAATFKVGLKVEFVPFSEMLRWETGFYQDAFNVVPIEHDTRFLQFETSLHEPTTLPGALQQGFGQKMGSGFAISGALGDSRRQPQLPAAVLSGNQSGGFINEGFSYHTS